ncbi:MAG: amino acid ABC transporter permease [Rhodobacteraceae bacterium]|nr:amino acid ABC transporter permease [Paracoccaceae bacterium]
MNYSLQFGQIAADVPYILSGAWPTLWITFVTFFAAATLGLFIAMARLKGGPLASRMAGLWVTLTTNSPLFVVLFFLFNGLPNWGILLSPIAATLIAFIAISSGYLAEIQRGGIQSVRQAELDAAETLGMSRLQTLRFVIAPHVIKTTYPALSNFFIFTILGTSMASLVGVNELTGRAIEVSSRTFRSIEVFSLVAVTYVVLSLFASAALALVGRWLFRVKARMI